MNKITTVGLALLLIGVGTVSNLRSFIRTEIQASTATTNATLEKSSRRSPGGAPRRRETPKPPNGRNSEDHHEKNRADAPPLKRIS